MSNGDAADDPDVITKAEFARRRNVKPPRVSQWIAAGQISGAALVGAGRDARIRESIACQQLNRNLDISQRLGNGLTTRLTPPASRPRPAAGQIQRPLDLAGVPSGSGGGEVGSGSGDADQPAVVTTQDMIAAERLIQLRRQNERERVQHAVEMGRLVDAAAAKAAAARQATRTITMMEGALSNIASAIAAEFKILQRDVLHIIRAEFRKVRVAGAMELGTEAAQLPELVEFDIEVAFDETE